MKKTTTTNNRVLMGNTEVYTAKLFYYLLVAILLLAPGPIGAVSGCAPSMVMVGGPPVPTSGHEIIRMDRQVVTIRLRLESYTVDAVFNFVNTGETTTEIVGFPRIAEDFGSAGICPDPGRLIVDFMGFDAWADDKKLELSEKNDFLIVAEVPGAETTDPDTIESRWMAAEVTFPGHAETTIRIRYKGRYGSHNTAVYYFGPGRHYWKGNVGKTVFNVDNTHMAGTNHVAVNFRKDRSPELIPRQTIGYRRIGENMARFELGNWSPYYSTKLTFSLGNVLP